MTGFEASEIPFTVVAIDGGAASGKSSTSRLLAERFGFLHVDTGTHYRSVARACIDAGQAPVDSASLDAFLGNLHLETVLNSFQSRLSINGMEPYPDELIRSPEVNHSVSQFAALPAVREKVRRFQQDQVRIARDAAFKGLVMEGRDIGTVILPQADLKIFLRADAQTRQKRRLGEGGLDRIEDRDKIDSSRQMAPLKAAPDAVCIDNSALSLPDVVEAISARIKSLVATSPPK